MTTDIIPAIRAALATAIVHHDRDVVSAMLHVANHQWNGWTLAGRRTWMDVLLSSLLTTKGEVHTLFQQHIDRILGAKITEFSTPDWPDSRHPQFSEAVRTTALDETIHFEGQDHCLVSTVEARHLIHVIWRGNPPLEGDCIEVDDYSYEVLLSAEASDGRHVILTLPR